MIRRHLLGLVCLFLLVSLVNAGGCARTSPAESLTLATTTSTQGSGLLDVLVPRFREQAGIEVKVVAVGTGQALELGRRGDADLLLVHDPEAERRFVDEGWGVGRRPVMYNDFVLVGPPADPAGARRSPAVAAAFAGIPRVQVPFVSRGDESGTHARERLV
jgi:tungstate transport system substrate-binding protein